VQRPPEPFPGPSQLRAELAVVRTAPIFEDRDVKERRVAVSAPDEPQGRRAGEGEALLRQMQDIVADSVLPLSRVFPFILHDKMGFVKGKFFCRSRACLYPAPRFRRQNGSGKNPAAWAVCKKDAPRSGASFWELVRHNGRRQFAS